MGSETKYECGVCRDLRTDDNGNECRACAPADPHTPTRGSDGKEEVRYPEHEKLKALGDRRGTVQDFLDFLLDDAGLELCARNEFDTLLPVHLRREELMAWFFEIDLQKIEEEKRAMLAELRRMNEK